MGLWKWLTKGEGTHLEVDNSQYFGRGCPQQYMEVENSSPLTKFGGLAVLVLLTGIVASGVKSCIYERKIGDGKTAVEIMVRYERDIKSFESKGYQKSADHIRRNMESYKAIILENLEDGDIIISPEDRDRYFK